MRQFRGGAYFAVCAFTLGCAPGAWALDEPNVAPGINRIYENADVVQWLAVFEQPGREIYDRRADIVKALGLRPGMTVADIGAGTGLFTIPMASAVGQAGRVYAVDIAPRFIAAIRERAAREGLTNVVGVVNTPHDVMLPDERIDLALICDTYHHFEYPRSTMRSLYRAMKPGGEVIVIDYRREPGRVSPWVMSHVRGGKADFIREILDAGFQLVDELDLLSTQYFLRFRKPIRLGGPG